MIRIFRYIVFGAFIFFLYICFALMSVYGDNVNNTLNNKTILVLCSYSSQNSWEFSILDGLKDGLENKLNFNVEYLDSKSSNSNEVIKSYVDFLNLKYKDKKIDCILAIDDEALLLSKKLVFDENSFMYHKKIVFAGVNNYVPLSNNEQKYIKGIFGYQDNSQLIDIILKSSLSIDTIYLLLDDSTYSNTLESNINSLKNICIRSFNVITIRSMYLVDVLPKIKNINPNSSAIILSSAHMFNNNNKFIDPKLVVEKIKTTTKTPIYTTLNSYVSNGTIGGKINDGYELGKIVSNLLLDTVSNSSDLHTTISFNSSFSKFIFNYDELMKYNIDPSILPNDTEFINKGPFDLLVSKPLKIIIYIMLLFVLAILVFMIKMYFNKRRIQINKDELLKLSLERDKIRTDFVLTMSHELRTPLNIISNCTSLLKLKIVNDDVDLVFFNSQLSMITKNSNRLLRLINNLIDVSKIDIGHMDATFTNENIVEVIEDTTMSVVDLAFTHGINVVFDTTEEEIITSIDKHKIERIMLNLLSNSIKFTNPGGEIYVKVEKNKNNITIMVKDTGIGISEDLQNNLFKKFSKEKSYSSLHREYEGSGLGLYIVKGLVSLHKGSLEVYSQVNKGTTFIVTLPYVTVDSKNGSNNFTGAPIDYVSKIELSDIDKD